MKFLVIVASVALCALAAEIVEEEGVLVLTNANFESAIKDNKYVLVEFYAPWCGHCKELAPSYAKAAQQLKESGSEIKLAKVDATEEADLAEKYEVRGYPTIQFFREEKPIEFGGDRTAEGIIDWLEKKTGPPAVDVKSKSDLDKLLERNVAVIGFFADQASAAAKVFLDVAAASDDVVFGITSDKDLMKDNEVKDEGIVVFKKFDEKRNNYEGDMDSEKILEFVKMNKMPLFVPFTEESASEIFGGEMQKHILVFVKKSDSNFEKVSEVFTSVAKENRGKLTFVHVDVEPEENMRIAEFFGIAAEDCPTYRLIDMGNDMAKYKPQSDEMTEDAVKMFVKSFMDGELKPHLMSADLPEDWDKNPVKVLVSSNFHEVVMNKDKSVLVEFYAPWCGHCKSLEPIYNELAEKYASSDKVVIAKMDSTANELADIKVESFPTLKFFPAGENKEVIDFNGERTLEGMTKFIDSDGQEGRGPTEEELAAQEAEMGEGEDMGEGEEMEGDYEEEDMEGDAHDEL